MFREMNRIFNATAWLAFFGVLHLGGPILAAEPDVRAVPELRLREQTIVARSPDRVNASDSLWAESGRDIRGYQMVNYAVDPQDPTKGSAWMAYDCGQKTPVVLIADVNALCRATPESTATHRISASAQYGGLLGTTVLPPAAAVEGGCVIRNSRLVGRLPAGWQVVAFEQQYEGKLWLDDEAEWPGKRPQCGVMLAASADGTSYALYGVLHQRLAPMEITGGPELRSFVVAASYVYYRDPAGALLRRNLQTGEAAEVVDEAAEPALALRAQPDYIPLFRGDMRHHGSNAVQPPIQFGIGNPAGDMVGLNWGPGHGRAKVGVEGVYPGVLAGVARGSADLWPRVWAWGGKLRVKEIKGDTYNSDLLEAAGLRKGFVVFTRRPAPGAAAHLYLYRPDSQALDDLGPLLSHDGEALVDVHQIRVTAGCELAVLASNDRVSVLQIYHNPLHQSMSAQKLLAYRHGYDQLGLSPPTVVRTHQNLYGLDDHADRGFDGMCVASDGKIYFGTMPHNPIKGASIFQYGPANPEGAVKRLGYLDEWAKTPATQVPSMIHTAPQELNGRLYFVGQDPFYGHRNFPGWTAEANVYAGSPFVMVDMQTGKAENLGVLFPGKNIFGLMADAKHQCLYAKEGYGVGVWYRLRIGDDGRPIGEPEALKLTTGRDILVAGDGKLYFFRSAAVEGTGRAAGDVWQYDPDTEQETVMASFDVEALHGSGFPGDRGKVTNGGRWCVGQDGSMTPVFMVPSVGMVLRFDIAAKTLSRCGMLEPEATKYPLDIYTPTYVIGAKLYYIVNVARHALGLRILDLATGELTDAGPLLDEQGRIIREMTQLALLPDGRLFFGGSAVALPSDTQIMGRLEYDDPQGVISGFFELPAPAR